jgi:hypothetical protein
MNPPPGYAPIIASSLRWIRKGTLQAAADIEICRWRLKIRGGMWHSRGANHWFAFPGREWVDRDGTRQFAPLLEFTDRCVELRFKAAALAAITTTRCRGGQPSGGELGAAATAIGSGTYGACGGQVAG